MKNVMKITCNALNPRSFCEFDNFSSLELRILQL